MNLSDLITTVSIIVTAVSMVPTLHKWMRKRRNPRRGEGAPGPSESILEHRPPIQTR